MSEKTPGGLLLPTDADVQETIALTKRAKADQPPIGAKNPSANAGGLVIDSGYFSPYFVTKPESLESVLPDALILVADRMINTPRELVPILDRVVPADRPLLIVAPGLKLEAAALLIINKLRGILRVCAIATTKYEDVARYVGCKTAAVESLRIDDLGSAKRVVANASFTVIEKETRPAESTAPSARPSSA